MGQMRSLARTNRLLDDLRDELKAVSTKIGKIEEVLDLDFPMKVVLDRTRRK